MPEDQSRALTILIIRHAEKEGEAWPGPGLTPEGIPDKKSLVVRGWQRAGAWAALFGTDLSGTDFPQPAVIYAADPDAITGEEPSQRPCQTVLPIAARLGLKPLTMFAVGQESKMAAAVVSQTGVILISWEHKAITGKLLPAIVQDQQTIGIPRKWDETRYDLVLHLDRASSEASWSFRQLCPCLLYNDSDAPMS